jgi:hypothetical protein
MTTTPSRRRAVMTFGIIGAGIAVAVIVGVLFVMPLLMAAPKTQEQLQRQQEEEEERQRILETPNTGEPGQPIIEHQELRRDDPTFDRFMVVWEKCWSDVQNNNVDPNVIIGCRQALEDGTERWCNISSEHYHEVKCNEVSENASLFDLGVRSNVTESGIA